MFLQEHDVILIAEPFAVLGSAEWREPHCSRLAEAIARRFLRSARELGPEDLATALQQSCTPTLACRLTHPLPESAPPRGLLLTCAPRAHLALAIFLERGALFTVEAIGRVCRKG